MITAADADGIRVYLLPFNVPGGARGQARGQSMFTPIIVLTRFPGAECVKAVLSAWKGAEQRLYGSFQHLRGVQTDCAREFVKAVCEVLNKCSVGETLRRIRDAILRGEAPMDILTCLFRDLWHISRATGRWLVTRMQMPDGALLARRIFKRLGLKMQYVLFDAGRADKRPGALQGVPFSAEEHKRVLLEAEAHMQFSLLITFEKQIELQSINAPFPDSVSLAPLSSVDALPEEETGAEAAAMAAYASAQADFARAAEVNVDGANAEAAGAAAAAVEAAAAAAVAAANAAAARAADANVDDLTPGEFRSLTAGDGESEVANPAVRSDEFYELFFRRTYPFGRELRIYLLKERSTDGKLRWLIKVGVSKDVEVLVGGINMSAVVETDVDVLRRIEEGELVSLPNAFFNPSLGNYNRDYKFPFACVAAAALLAVLRRVL